MTTEMHDWDRARMARNEWRRKDASSAGSMARATEVLQEVRDQLQELLDCSGMPWVSVENRTPQSVKERTQHALFTCEEAERCEEDMLEEKW